MENIAIIGGGLGGLSVGALLAQDGYKVTLLEQHTLVGGCATTFKRGDFFCEVGLHEMDGVYSDPYIHEIFTKLKVYENVEFLKAPEFFKVYLKNDTFIMPDGIENAINALNKKFPKEQRAIQKYFELIEKITHLYTRLQKMSWYHYMFFPFIFSTLLRYKNKTVTEVFQTLFSDEKLKLILNTNVQYYNDTPNDLSFLLHSVAQYSYYKGGGYFIKGGSGKLSDYLASIIEKNGGKVIKKANVIQCGKQKLTYTFQNNSYTISYNKVISNLSPKSTYKLFNYPYREQKELADSLLTIYIGFSKNLKSIYGKNAYSNFISGGIENLEEFNQMIKKDITQRGFVFVDYSQIDSKLTKVDDKSFGVICMTDYLKDWKSLTKQEYKQKKLELEKALIKRLELYYPNISDYIEYIETGTSKTVQSYIKTQNATAYGFKATPKQFFKIPQLRSKKIYNLYFVGQWVIAGGFRPSINSGYMCYKEIIK